MYSVPKSITEALNNRKQSQTFRCLSSRYYEVDFYSNDYLGLARNPLVRERAQELLQKYPLQNGSTGSRLLSGNYSLIEEAEYILAQFHHSERGLIFNSGYDANIGIFSSIPQKGDIVLYDQYIHASIRDGLQLSKAQSFKYKHNSLSDLEDKLQRFSEVANTLYIATEGIFSMDGDIPDLIGILTLAEKYNAYIIIDEAHSVGVLGDRGEGLCQSLGVEKRIFLRLITFGKGVGSHGAIALAYGEVIDYLVNFARSFIYTTAPSPEVIAPLLAAYELLPSLVSREKLRENIAFFQRKVQEFEVKNTEKMRFILSQSAIQGLIIPDNERLKKLSDSLQSQGIGVKPIFSPTVPKEQERLRICLHSFNTKEEIERLFKNI